MRILVTGATGFIGKYFIPTLLNEGYCVRLLVRDIDKARNLFGDKCEYHIGDITDKESLKDIGKDVDIVFHLVAKSGNELPSKENYNIFHKINVEGTENLINECKKIKKFIYVSSTAAMGLVKDIPITEESKCNPYLPYQVTKYEVENLLRKKYEKEGFPAITIRPTKVYGVKEPNYSYLTLAKLIKKGIFFKVGNGHNYTSNIYVSDFVNALVNLINYGIIGETYIVSSKDSIDFIETGKIIAEELGTKFKIIKLPEWFMVMMATIEENLLVAIGKKPIVTKRNIQMTIQDLSLIHI